MGAYHNSTLAMRKLIFIVLFVFLFLADYNDRSVAATIPPLSHALNRLLVIGDSLTSGLYASSENATYARLVADATKMQLARRYVSTLSLAIDEWSKVKVWRPGVIVLEVGLNDVSRERYTESWQPQYQSLVDDMRSTGARVVVVTMFWAGIQPSHPNYAKYIALNTSIRDVAKRTGVSVADVWSATVNCKDCVSDETDDSYFSPHYHGDGFHPNDVGHALIAQVVVEAIRQCVCDSDNPEPNRILYYLPVMKNE